MATTWHRSDTELVFARPGGRGTKSLPVQLTWGGWLTNRDTLDTTGHKLGVRREAASPGYWQETQIREPHPDLLRQKVWRVARQSVSVSPPGGSEAHSSLRSTVLTTVAHLQFLLSCLRLIISPLPKASHPRFWVRPHPEPSLRTPVSSCTAEPTASCSYILPDSPSTGNSHVLYTTPRQTNF